MIKKEKYFLIDLYNSEICVEKKLEDITKTINDWLLEDEINVTNELKNGSLRLFKGTELKFEIKQTKFSINIKEKK